MRKLMGRSFLQMDWDGSNVSGKMADVLLASPERTSLETSSAMES